MASDMKRSEIMAAVKSKDTTPELKVRKLLHSLGYRYRLHAGDLPCKPDIVFRSRKKVIFIHGCFWHGHPCKRGARMPKTNAEYWIKKIGRNIERDRRGYEALHNLGWRCLVLWECELKDEEALQATLQTFLKED